MKLLRKNKTVLLQIISLIFLQISKLLNCLLKISKLERTSFGTTIIGWLIKLHSNRLFFLIIYSIFFTSRSRSGDRLQKKETYKDCGSHLRRALFGIERTLLGQLLVWRNNKSYQSKLNSNRKIIRSKTKKKLEVLCLSRSWHFFDAVQKVLKTDESLLVRTVDINDYDDLLVANNIYGINKSLNNQNEAIRLFKNAVDSQASNPKHAEILNSKICEQRLKSSDVYFVDWLNQNTIWTLLYAPYNAKVIVRVHSYEVFSYFALLVDYGRIDQLIFVSQGIKDAFLELWSWLLPPGCKISVIDNIRSIQRFSNISYEKFYGLEACEYRKFNIGMVQYGEEVKDFAFALRCFKKIVEEDKRYTLHLAGNSFLINNHKDSEYLQTLINEIGEKHIKEHGFVTDISKFYKDIGIMLSTSIREGSHEAIVEGMYFGCVPVIRNWPLLDVFNGAKNAFPDYENYSNENDFIQQIINVSENFIQLSNEAKMNSEKYFSSDIPKKYIEVVNRVAKN